MMRLGHILRNAFLRLRNRLRLRYRDLDYVLIALPASMPELPEPRGWLRQQVLGRPPLSLWELDRLFDRIAADPRPRGVILRLNEPAMSLATLQTLRDMIGRLRSSGKRIVCFAQNYSIGAYLIASACDEILLQPGGELTTLGLRQQAVYLKNALDAIGVGMDVVAISPYKGVFDQFSRTEASPEGREQMEWLLDSRYQQVIGAIAESRALSPDAVRTMIDTSPHLADDAAAAGYIDAVLYEEDLPARLKIKHILTQKDAERRLIKLPRPGGKKYIAVLPIRGLMMPGESGEPPGGISLPIPFVGESRAGDLTIVRQARNLLKDDSCAAVVLYIDSGGGAVISAEAMTAALNKLAAKRPVVAYMHSVAASGGYHVATAARWIVAQPGTITGSIGVVSGKPLAGGLRGLLRINTLELSRGANADLFTDTAPFTPEQRAKVRHMIETLYEQFIAHVARARRLTPEVVDAVGGGRVWTGSQALGHHLVDELGGIEVALKKAREFASLPDATPIHLMLGKGKPQPPFVPKEKSAVVDNIAMPYNVLNYLLDGARAICGGKAQMLMPFSIDSKDMP